MSALAAYRLATRLVEPFAPTLLRARVRRGKEDPARLGERTGHPSRPRPAGPLVWLHGASVGESLSILPLIDALRAERPDATLLVTSGTVTSADLLGRRLPGGVVHQYLPIDAPGPVGRFLDHWRPDLALFVESEVWPNLLTGARARGVRTALISARLSQSSVRTWARLRGAARVLFGGFDLVLAQDAEAARRLAALGASIDGTLNLKLVGDPLPVDPDALAALTLATADRTLLLAASTHLGEEALVAASWRGMPADATLIIVPRHPARGPALAAQLGAGLRSLGAPVGGPIYIADTLGELGLWIRAARGVFVGGSLVTGVGGHNPLEVVRLGRAAAAGPHVENWTSIYADLAAAGGVTRVGTPEDLNRFWLTALKEHPGHAAQIEHARRFAETQGGQLDGAMAAITRLLP